MANKKGSEKKGGRVKGTPNKITLELRSWVALLIDNNRQQLEKDLKALDPKERWNIIEKLIQYTIPKMQSVSNEIEFAKLTDEQINHIIKSINYE
jgi:hypothetical protein